jgi:hypothetical protein
VRTIAPTLRERTGKREAMGCSGVNCPPRPRTKRKLPKASPKSKPRPLPDQCYDFFVRDSRDGEKWGPYDTPTSAKKQQEWLRAYVEPHMRCVYYVTFNVNEQKVLWWYSAK